MSNKVLLEICHLCFQTRGKTASVIQLKNKSSKNSRRYDVNHRPLWSDRKVYGTPLSPYLSSFDNFIKFTSTYWPLLSSVPKVLSILDILNINNLQPHFVYVATGLGPQSLNPLVFSSLCNYLYLLLPLRHLNCPFHYLIYDHGNTLDHYFLYPSKAKKLDLFILLLL